MLSYQGMVSAAAWWFSDLGDYKIDLIMLS